MIEQARQCCLSRAVAVCTVLREPARYFHFPMLTDEIRLRIMRELQNEPGLSQRDLAKALGVSLGKTNYCLRALVEKGLVKVENFRKSGNKLAYAYQLTPRGITDKAKMTRRFLRIKQREFDSLKTEIAELKREVTQIATVNSRSTGDS